MIEKCCSKSQQIGNLVQQKRVWLRSAGVCEAWIPAKKLTDVAKNSNA